MRIRKNDVVKILSGKYKGKTGRVLRVDPEKGICWVEGVRLVKRHTRPTQKNPKGGVVEKEGSLSLSKVQLMDTKNNMPSRVGYRVLTNEQGQFAGKVRIAKRTGEAL